MNTIKSHDEYDHAELQQLNDEAHEEQDIENNQVTQTICFKASPIMRDAFKTAAEDDGRSLSNWVNRILTVEISELDIARKVEDRAHLGRLHDLDMNPDGFTDNNPEPSRHK